MEAILHKGAHAVYSLQFHYVACVEFRRKIFSDEIGERLKTINHNVARAYDIAIIEQEVVGDHVRILLASKPQIQLSKFVNSLKSVSARLLFREFPELRHKLWKGHLWSPSYFLASAGSITHQDLKNYIENPVAMIL